MEISYREMNVYDFDKTIYRGDSSIDFFFFCLKRHPRLVINIPYQLTGFIMYGIKKIDKTQLKETFFSFLKLVSSPEKEVELFWGKNKYKIEKWYFEKRKGDDVVVSTSPEFLVAPICKMLEVHDLIGSVVDVQNGKFLQKNCRGEEKVRRFRNAFPKGEIQEFYSDSNSDRPMATIAKNAYKVNRGGEIVNWNKKAKV